MVQGYIYRHWIVNDEGVEKSYIGQTIENNPRRRWSDGKGYTRQGQGTKMSRAIKKYGWENFSHEIIGIVESDTKEQLVKDLDEWEKYYIFKYDSFYNGYNSTTGGSNGLHTEETKKKLSELKQGEKSVWYGRKHTEETKRKISTSQKGKVNEGALKMCLKVECVTTGEIFDSIRQASRFYNIDCSGLTKCCKGKLKSCGKHPETGEKLIWKYYE